MYKVWLHVNLNCYYRGPDGNVCVVIRDVYKAVVLPIPPFIGMHIATYGDPGFLVKDVIVRDDEVVELDLDDDEDRKEAEVTYASHDEAVEAAAKLIMQYLPGGWLLDGDDYHYGWVPIKPGELRPISDHRWANRNKNAGASD